MIKIFVATAVIIAGVIGVTVQQINAEVTMQAKPVECLDTKTFVTNARSNGYMPLVGGLGNITTQSGNEQQVAVVWWVNSETEGWIISEVDPTGATCVIGYGNANNFDVEQINYILDQLTNK